MNDENTKQGRLEGVAILEGGMISGKTSVGIVIKMEDGGFVMAQTSAEILNAIVASIRGAEARWNG